MSIHGAMRIVLPIQHHRIQTSHAENHGVMGRHPQINCHHPWTFRVIGPWVQTQLLLHLIWVMTPCSVFNRQWWSDQVYIILCVWMVGEGSSVPFLFLFIDAQVQPACQVPDDSDTKIDRQLPISSGGALQIVCQQEHHLPLDLLNCRHVP